MKIGIIGKGAFGLALKKVFSFSHKVEIYGREAENLNPKLVPELLFLAIPSDAKIKGENAVKFYINHFNKSSIVLTSKGMETIGLYQYLTPKEREKVFIFSGPNLSDQLGESLSAVVLAGENLEKSQNLAKFLSNELLTVIPSNSPLVVQYGGVLKNLLAFHLGQHWEELDTIDRKTVFILNAVMAGISIIKKNVGVNFTEFRGISGVGDLLLCLDLFPIKKDGLMSRNFLAGQALARGATEQEMYKGFKTVESYKIVKEMKNDIINEFDTPQLKSFLIDLQEPNLIKKIEIDFNKKIYKEMSVEWKLFKKEVRRNHYFSNTFAWKFCEILQNSAKKHNLDLSDENKFRDILGQLLYIVQENQKSSNYRILSNLSKRFSFLKKL